MLLNETTINKYTKLPISEVTKIPDKDGAFEIYKNRWWAVTEDDCILKYRNNVYHCNTDKKIAEQLTASATHPGVKVKFIEKVYLPHSCD